MSVYIPIDLQRQVRARYSSCCAYCGTAEHLTVSIFEIEHVVPLSAGGETVLENLCFACPTCNRCKSDRQSALDPLTGTESSLFHPCRDRWTDHFAWSENGEFIIAKTPTGRTTVHALRMNREQLIRVRRMWVAMNEHPPPG